jgi:hypothetical protein
MASHAKCHHLYACMITHTHAQMLSFKRGDVLAVVRRTPSGWWLGQIGDRAGACTRVYACVRVRARVFDELL